MNKKFIVIFENLEPIHLGKDVGMLPKTLQNNTNWDVSIFSTLKKFNNIEFEKSCKLKFFTFFKNRKLNKILLIINLMSFIFRGSGVIFHLTSGFREVFAIAKIWVEETASFWNL